MAKFAINASGAMLLPSLVQVSESISGSVVPLAMFTIFLATGEVTSPNYPNNYPNNLKKTEKIQVDEGLILSLEFTSFDIESHSTCRFDHLTITDGDGTTLMEKSCGNSLPADITSTSNVVNLLFSTDDYDGTNSGWSVSWSAVTPGEFQHHILAFLEFLDNFDFFAKSLFSVWVIIELFKNLSLG